MDDILIHGILHHPIYLARKDMINAYGIGQILKTSRSLLVSKDTSNAQLNTQMLEAMNHAKLSIFPEGTNTAAHCVIRFRPGAFKLGELVQPVAIHYHTIVHAAWLCESGLRHILEFVCNLFSLVEYEYLDVIENETPDQCGKRIAIALGAEYLPYTNQDFEWFLGRSSDFEKCTAEYRRDFGWMGQFKDYEKICLEKGRNPRFYWTKKELKLE